MDVDQKVSSYIASSYGLSSERLKRFMKILRAAIEPDASDQEIKEDLKEIYARFRIAYDGFRTGFVSEDVFTENAIREEEHFFNVLKRAVREGATEDDHQAVVTHNVFWTPRPPINEATEVVTGLQRLEESVVMNSWNAEFVYDAPLKGLKNHVKRELKSLGSDQKLYARYCSIIQSSGMGKSRLIDELSREDFLIPINLRPHGSKGLSRLLISCLSLRNRFYRIPPPDNELRDFLAGPRGSEDTALLAYYRAYYFLLALFKVTQDTIVNELDPHSDDANRAYRIRAFRELMSNGQNMRSVGADRQSFYNKVVAQASSGMSAQPKADVRALFNAFDRLRDALNRRTNRHALPSEKQSQVDMDIEIYILFDEAHSLTTPFGEHDWRSPFTELRRILQILRKRPMWSFFLSTSAKITEFSHVHSADPSNRGRQGELIIPQPYIYLGFDQLMQTRKISKHSTLKDVTSLECIAHMGRPLWGTLYDHGNQVTREGLIDFAMEKLLCGSRGPGPLSDARIYAVLSQRLALDIDSSQYHLSSVTPLNLAEIIHEQITYHMRVCISVGKEFESMHAVASSEPILSEAASRIMNDGRGINLPVALEKVFSGFSVSQEARGELLVAAWFTWARDQVVKSKGEPCDGALCHFFTVKELFKNLFPASIFELIAKTKPSLCPQNGNTNQPLFKDAFKRARMHFNHFIKPYEHEVLARKYLIRFMARGAAALGTNCQPGFDAVYPFLYGDIHLDVQKLGFILVQVKNNASIGPKEFNGIFRDMDPFEYELLDASDKENGIFPIPIIRLLFSLSSKGDPKVEHMKYELPSDGATALDDDGQALFTSYDYVCSGVSEDVLKPVAADSPDMWKALVNTREGWDAFLRSSNEPELLVPYFPVLGVLAG
ncbi:hypothetical protein B0F90DRAFT_1816405 [Multifurca ochricompacta]|uniref:Uncharacterized protein n=1 Tax=Multifurca ochricompacta TaxID=376703 RepID=A0AAD4QPH6_9AGAM|nr:hypothetical protein B0F90DRAFT_1816405 [Multifurca ochricompacta]